MWPSHRPIQDDEPVPERADDEQRSVLVWFTSPRQAVRVLYGLSRLAPAARIRLGVSQATGAEGEVIVASGRVPADDQPRLQRAFDALEVAVMWDGWGELDDQPVMPGADG
jgi:hypothetical protein